MIGVAGAVCYYDSSVFAGVVCGVLVLLDIGYWYKNERQS